VCSARASSFKDHILQNGNIVTMSGAIESLYRMSADECTHFKHFYVRGEEEDGCYHMTAELLQLYV
jgi:hypothetical protein